MSKLQEQERAAMEVVGKRFRATWEERSDPAGAYLMVDGKRVAVDIRTLHRRGTGQGDSKPRLRFDKVATRLIERLQASLRETVPDGVTVVATVTAPIRLPSKTAASLEEKIQRLLARAAAGGDEKDTIHGNGVRIRILRGASEGAPKVIGFVHNSDSDPVVLLNMTNELLGLMGTGAGGRAGAAAGDRWLVAISSGGSSRLETYRYIYSQLRMTAGFQKIVMVFGDGGVGTLTE